jgi:hypothetical protein
VNAPGGRSFQPSPIRTVTIGSEAEQPAVGSPLPWRHVRGLRLTFGLFEQATCRQTPSSADQPVENLETVHIASGLPVAPNVEIVNATAGVDCRLSEAREACNARVMRLAWSGQAEGSGPPKDSVRQRLAGSTPPPGVGPVLVLQPCPSPAPSLPANETRPLPLFE